MSESDQQFADGLIDATDVAILEQVATMYDQIDPMPTGLVDRLRFAITLDALNAEVAELQELSFADSGARSESTSEIKTLTFTSDTISTMVSISPAGPDRVRIDGWTEPDMAVRIELRQDAGSLYARADSDGRFVFAEVPHGMTRFLITFADSDKAPVITPAVEI